MFEALFENAYKPECEWDQVDDRIYIVKNGILRSGFRIGPFVERYTGDWNVDLENLSIELIDSTTESGTFGGMEFTLTYKPTVF